MGRGDGIHFGTGEEPQDGILGILGSDAPCLMNEPEAQHWWEYMHRRRPEALTVWRAAPSLKPEDVHWQADAYASLILDGIDFHHRKYGTRPSEVLLLNELNLDYERGDARGDGGAFDTNPANWPGLYAKLARFLDELLEWCKAFADQRSWSPRWWFQGWAPEHGEMSPEIAALWVPVARRYDAICYHAYRDLQSITDITLWYAETFPDKPLLLGEWNMGGYGGDWRSSSRSGRERLLGERIQEEARVRGRLKAFARQLPSFHATYFIHRWESDDSREHDIREHDVRMALWDGRMSVQDDGWQLPGSVTEPQPQEPPMIEAFPLPVDDHGNEWQADYATMLAAILEVAPQEINPSDPDGSILLLLACGLAESGFDLQSQERWHIWTGHGKEAVRQRNLGYAAQVLSWGREVGTIGTNDFSAGAFHQAMAWWEDDAEPDGGFPGNPTDPADPYRWDVSTWLSFRKRFIQDHGYATRYAARRLKAYYDQRPANPQWCLERYNKPNGEVSDGVRANYARALDRAREVMRSMAPPAPDVPPVAPPPSGTTAFEQYRTPYIQGRISEPRGVILHGSRSGRASNPLAAEYAGTARYATSNPDGLSWHATIGDGVVAVHMAPDEWGWNAAAASKWYVAVEIAQPTNMNEVTDGQVRALVDYLFEHVLVRWPDLPMRFPSHAEVERSGETGAVWGKDDVFPYGDPRMDILRGRIMAAIAARRSGGEVVPEPVDVIPSPESDTEKAARLVNAVGYLTGDIRRQIEEIRSQVDDGISRSTDLDMHGDDISNNLDRFWANWDRAYADLGKVLEEIDRVGTEQLK